MERMLFPYLLYAWLALAAAPFVALFFITAPYGRHARRGWGPALDARLGWFIMEAPASLLFAVYYLCGGTLRTAMSLTFLGLWQSHYLYRAFIYPWLLRERGKKMPLAVVAMGLFFNTVNAYFNGRWLFAFSGGYPASWLITPQFLAGAALFLAGGALNRWSDRVLLRLRAPGETGYKIPYGGLYRWVSCPNYLGEIVEWVGWALATWSWAGLAFAIWTVANLAPRAFANHRWYRKKFREYPPERKRLVPGVW